MKDAAPELVTLPKWPALVVEGAAISPKLAAEILIRTDRYLPDFTWAGNDRELRVELCALFGISEPPADLNHTRAYYEALDRLQRRLKKLPLDYLSNSRIVSSWIGGPHGWLNWDGTIGCCNYNIGKYPSVTAVLSDWTIIARAFPSLKLTSWLYDREIGDPERQPVARFVVDGGHCEAFVQRQNDTVPLISSDSVSVTGMVWSMMAMPARVRESGISVPALREKLTAVYGKIPQLRIVKPKVAP